MCWTILTSITSSEKGQTATCKERQTRYTFHIAPALNAVRVARASKAFKWCASKSRLVVKFFWSDSAIIKLATQNLNCNLRPAIGGPIHAHPVPNQAALTPKQQWLLLSRCAPILSREQRNCNMKLVSRFLKFLTLNSVGHFTSEICAELTSTNCTGEECAAAL